MAGTFFRAFGILAGFFHIVELHLQQAFGIGPVLVLGFGITQHDDACRDMRHAYSGVGFVDVLPACARGPHRIDAHVIHIEINVDIFNFGQDGDRCRRGMDTTLRFRDWNALHPVNAGLKFHSTIDPCAGHAGADFFKPAHIGFCRGLNLHPPALEARIALIHGEQIARENSRFIAARPSADFENDGRLIVFVFGQQQE